MWQSLLSVRQKVTQEYPEIPRKSLPKTKAKQALQVNWGDLYLKGKAQANEALYTSGTKGETHITYRITLTMASY